MAVAMHVLLARCLHCRVHECLVLIVYWMAVLLLLPVERLMRMASLVEALPVLMAFHGHHVVILHILGHCRSGTERVHVIDIDSVLEAVAVMMASILRSLELRGLQVLLLALVDVAAAADGAHARLRPLLLSLILLLRVAGVLWVLLGHLSVAVSVALSCRWPLALRARHTLPVHWTVLLREVLGVRFDEFACHVHALVHLLQSVAAILLHPGFLRSWHRLRTV